MTWLERLKDLRRKGGELPEYRQNRQNPGFVSFDSPVEARVPYRERVAPDPDAGSQVEAVTASEQQLVRWRGEGQDLGDLRPCLWCGNLARNGRCLAAARGELRAARDYSPTKPDLPQRCIGYLPPGDDPDQRPGCERWPELVETQARRVDGDLAKPTPAGSRQKEVA